MNKKLWMSGLLLGLLFLIPKQAVAGGWSLVTLEQLPTDVIINEPIIVQFWVKAHGVTAYGGLTPQLTAVHVGTGFKLAVDAQETAETGLYTAEFVLPEAGTWQWEIAPYKGLQGYEVEMPAMTVQPLSINGQQIENTPSIWLWLFSLLLAVVVTLVVARGRPLSTGRWVAVGLGVVGIIVLGLWGLSPTLVGQPDVVEAAELSPAEVGAALFVAKGCRQCHVNLNAEGQTLYHIGPNLTEYQGNPEFLRQWLADPQSVRSDTIMPNLDLEDAEIEALIAFLSESHSTVLQK